MKLHKKVTRLVVRETSRIVAQFIYFAGLTALIPLMPLVLSPEKLIAARFAFFVAVVLILVSFFIIYWISESKKYALRALGMTTLFPGLLAVLFSYAGPRRMANFLRMLGEASPFLEEYIESYVPKAWLLAGIYIIVGVILVWLSEKVRR